MAVFVRNRYILAADLPLIFASAVGAFAMRFDWRFYEERPEFPLYVVAALIIKPVVFRMLGMYNRYWRYASIQELLVVAIAVTASALAMGIVVQGGTMLGSIPAGFSRVVFLTDWLLTLVTTGGMRLAVRVVNEPSFGRTRSAGRTARNVLIVGAGAAGTMVAREMRRNPQLGMVPAGFLDDDPAKVGKTMAGLRVLGRTPELPGVVRACAIDSVIIAMPSARGAAVRSVLDMCRQAGVPSQTIPGVFELLDGQVSVSRLRDVDIADLLRRSPVVGPPEAAAYLEGQCVLVTGAGGSIGSELCRQVAFARPGRLVLLGHGENSIYDVQGQLREQYPAVVVDAVIADVRDQVRIEAVFSRFRPDVVFHAAAHKHVPLMEQNPEEAITNNVLGTAVVVAAAERFGARRLVLVSTDKAVAPSSIMGASKRLAESVVRLAAQRTGQAFMAVRFGNVLGSRGSVVPSFKKQIERGGPVTVTHPEMKRFFMTIPEAVHLVLQAGGIGRGGELFVLNMGEPVRIQDLAADLIRLSGLELDDIPLVFTGMRPGEKLEEQLWEADAAVEPTANPDVFRVFEGSDPRAGDVARVVPALADAARRGDRAAVQALVAECLETFVPPAPAVGVTQPMA